MYNQPPSIHFPGAVYDESLLNNPVIIAALTMVILPVALIPLLEAMACGCSIIAHDNPFNRAVLGDDADYFKDESAITVARPGAG